VATASSEVAVSTPLGRLAHGRPRVRITKITSTCVTRDSMNQPVRNSASSACMMCSNSQKVSASNAELMVPNSHM